MWRRLGELSDTIRHLTFSPDGKHLAVTFAAGLRVWETSGWKQVGEYTDYKGRDSYCAAFDARGTLYTVADDGYLRRYGPGFKLQAKVKTQGGKHPFNVAVHPSGDRVAVGFDDSTKVEVYDTRSLKRLFAADTMATSALSLGQATASNCSPAVPMR
jgi:WD40 repeat protein